MGLTADKARLGGIDAAAAEMSVADSVDPSWTLVRDPRGAVGVVADRIVACSWDVDVRAARQRVAPPGCSRNAGRALGRCPVRPGRTISTYSEAYLAVLARLDW